MPGGVIADHVDDGRARAAGVVQVGNAVGEGRPGITGIEAAAPVMFDLFRLLPTSKWFETPKTKL